MLASRWWEGNIIELNDLDEAKVTVYFPGEDDTQTVKTWNLRPSLQWDDGVWVPSADSTITHVPTVCRTSLDYCLVSSSFLLGSYSCFE